MGKKKRSSFKKAPFEKISGLASYNCPRKNLGRGGPSPYCGPGKIQNEKLRAKIEFFPPRGKKKLSALKGPGILKESLNVSPKNPQIGKLLKFETFLKKVQKRFTPKFTKGKV